jgi:hypothetical protein
MLSLLCNCSRGISQGQCKDTEGKKCERLISRGAANQILTPFNVDACQGDVLDEHFQGMSDVKNDVPLNSIPSISEEGRKIVLNEDQADLNAAAVPANYSEWLQHKIETAKQESGHLAVPELAEQCEEGSIGFDKSRALNEVSVDQALVESCVVYEDALLGSVSRLGMVDGPQLVAALHGDTSLIQVTPPLQLRIEDGSGVGLSAEYEALPGFEAMGCLPSSSIAWLPCPQKGYAAPGAAVGAAVGNEHQENVFGKWAREGEGRGEYAGGKGDHSALFKTPVRLSKKQFIGR